MGLLENVCLLWKRLCSTCPDVSSSPLNPSRKTIPVTTYPKRLSIKTSPHQCDSPEIDPINIPHLRIKCTDPVEDSWSGRISVCVWTSWRVCPLNGLGLSLDCDSPQSGDQPVHISPLPCTGSKGSPRRWIPKSIDFFFCGYIGKSTRENMWIHFSAPCTPIILYIV